MASIDEYLAETEGFLERPAGRCALLALGVILLVVSVLVAAGCTGLRYENENGPRGPERLEILGTSTKAVACCPEQGD